MITGKTLREELAELQAFCVSALDDLNA